MGKHTLSAERVVFVDYRMDGFKGFTEIDDDGNKLFTQITEIKNGLFCWKFARWC